jgi:hypothetical protein
MSDGNIEIALHHAEIEGAKICINLRQYILDRCGVVDLVLVEGRSMGVHFLKFRI